MNKFFIIFLNFFLVEGNDFLILDISQVSSSQFIYFLKMFLGRKKIGKEKKGMGILGKRKKFLK